MSGIEQIFCSDSEYLSQVLRHTNVRAMQISPGPFSGTLTRYCVDGWNVQYIEFTAGASACFGDAPKNRYAMLMPLSVTRGNRLLGRPVGNSSVGLYAPGSEHGDVTRAGTRQVVFMPPANLLDEFPDLYELLPKSGSKHCSVSQASIDQFRRAIQEIHSSVCADESVLERPEVVRSIEDTLLAALRMTARESEGRKSRGRPEHSRPALLRDLRNAVAEADGEPLFANELCRTLKISFPTLRRMFLDWYGVPPARYLQLRRYYLARERLATGRYRTVGEAAQSCGFWNPSRFASNYKSLFRELPSVTLARAEKKSGRRPMI